MRCGHLSHFFLEKSVGDIGLSFNFLTQLSAKSSFGHLHSSSLRLSLLSGVELSFGFIMYQFESICFEMRGAGPQAQPQCCQLYGDGDAVSWGPGHCIGFYFNLEWSHQKQRRFNIFSFTGIMMFVQALHLLGKAGSKFGASFNIFSAYVFFWTTFKSTSVPVM